MSDTDTVDPAELDEDAIPGAVADLLKEVRDYLDDEVPSNDKRGQRLVGKIDLALDHWFEPDDDEDDDEGDDAGDEDDDEDDGEDSDEGYDDDEDDGED